MFIIIRSNSSDVVQRVVQIAQETKRIRHRADDDDEELFQYLTYDEEKPGIIPKKSKRIIKLDDKPEAASKKEYAFSRISEYELIWNYTLFYSPAYKPLTTLTIHLSKIPIPELMPKSAPTSSRPSVSSTPHHSSSGQSRPQVLVTPPSSSRPPASSSRPSAQASSSSSGGKLHKPTSDPKRNGRHGRSSSAEPRPPPPPQPSNSNIKINQPRPPPAQNLNANPNQLNPGAPRPRPVSAYGMPMPSETPGFMAAGPPQPLQSQQHAWLPQTWGLGGGGGGPSTTMPAPRPVTPVYPAQQQPQQQSAQSASGAMSMFGKLLSRI